jgi:hypothetical protein
MVAPAAAGRTSSAAAARRRAGMSFDFGEIGMRRP